MSKTNAMNALSCISLFGVKRWHVAWRCLDSFGIQCLSSKSRHMTMNQFIQKAKSMKTFSQRHFWSILSTWGFLFWSICHYVNPSLCKINIARCGVEMEKMTQERFAALVLNCTMRYRTVLSWMMHDIDFSPFWNMFSRPCIDNAIYKYPLARDVSLLLLPGLCNNWLTRYFIVDHHWRFALSEIERNAQECVLYPPP